LEPRTDAEGELDETRPTQFRVANDLDAGVDDRGWRAGRDSNESASR
jgi:hypothetical protein